MSEFYRFQDVQEILQIALTKTAARENEFSREQLVDMSSELGISTEVLDLAEQQWRKQIEERQKQQVLYAHRRRQFQKHLFWYLMVNSFLLIIDWISDQSISWAIWPILGWGIGLSIDLFSLQKIVLPKE